MTFSDEGRAAPTAVPDDWPRVWRGESSGEAFERFDLGKTRHGVGFFFAQRHEQAEFYAGRGSAPRAFALDPGRTLELLNLDPVRPPIDAAAVLDELRSEFDEWIERRSGEPMDVWEFLESGSLYDYEGTGSGERWNRLFALARAHGFDSVKVLDQTDGVQGEDAVVWVVFDPDRIHALPCPVPAARPMAPRRSF